MRNDVSQDVHVTGWEQLDAGPGTGVQCGKCHDTVRFYLRHPLAGLRCGRCQPTHLTPSVWRSRREAALRDGVRALTGGAALQPRVAENIRRALAAVWDAGCATGACPGRAAK